MIYIGALVYRPAVQLQALVLAVYASTHMQYKYTDQETIYVGSHMSVQSNAVVLYSDSRCLASKLATSCIMTQAGSIARGTWSRARHTIWEAAMAAAD